MFYQLHYFSSYIVGAIFSCASVLLITLSIIYAIAQYRMPLKEKCNMLNNYVTWVAFLLHRNFFLYNTYTIQQLSI